MPRFSILPLILVAMLAVAPTHVLAHAVAMTCTIRPDKIDVEVFYDEGSPAPDAEVQVINAREEVVFKGVSDKEGNWSFKRPEPGKYEIRVNAGAGHRAKKTLEIPAPPPPPEVPPNQLPTINDDPPRGEATRTRWKEMLFGFAILAASSGALYFMMRMRRRG